MRVAVLVSGSGTLLQAVIDAQIPGLQLVAVGADAADIEALRRARTAGIATFVVDPRSFEDRGSWNAALANELRACAPDLIVSAGFMRIIGPDVVTEFSGRMINTHPALLPSFPGAHGVADALAYGVKVTGCTVHFIDAGVDTGEIIAQRTVAVMPDDTVETLHERIKVVERELLVDVLNEFARKGSL